jgi:hypothetical protein
MNQIKPQLKQRYTERIGVAFAEGFTRRQACRAAKLHHATFYRWLARDPEFRELVLTLEAQHAKQREWHRWWTHPFRGKRPPRKPSDNASYPATRFDLPPWTRYPEAFAKRSTRPIKLRWVR